MLRVLQPYNLITAAPEVCLAGHPWLCGWRGRLCVIWTGMVVHTLGDLIVDAFAWLWGQWKGSVSRGVLLAVWKGPLWKSGLGNSSSISVSQLLLSFVLQPSGDSELLEAPEEFLSCL